MMKEAVIVAACRTAAGKASQIDSPAVSTSQRATSPPRVKMAACARFRMSSTPNTKVYPTAKRP